MIQTMGRRLPAHAALAALLLIMTGVAGCASSGAREGLDVARLPAEVQPDYTLFAHRCSKCHPLARALNSGIDDDGRWVDYVTRMRRQPGSGITPEDTAPILRFLHYYSLEQRRAKRSRASHTLATEATPAPEAGGAAPDQGADR